MFTTVNTKTVERLDAEKGVNKPFEKFSCLRRNQKFFKEGAPNFNIFPSVVLSGRINVKQVEEQKRLQRVRGHAPWEIFLNSRLLKAILMHFEQFSGKLY